MNSYDDAAGGQEERQCPKCGKKQMVYSRSFYGVGKKCVNCGFVFYPNGVEPKSQRRNHGKKT